MWFALCLLVSACLLALFQSRAKLPKGLSPAPGYVPYFGHLILLRKLLSKDDDSFLDFATKTAEDHNQKPYCVILPNKQPIVRITTQEAAKHVLKDNFTNYIKIDTEYTRMIGKEFFGEKGIFVLDGEEWRFERKVASRMFSANVLNNMMEETFLEHGDILMRILNETAKKGETIDMQGLMKRFTMDSIAKIGFGAEFGSLENDDEEFSKAFDGLQETIIQRAFRPEVIFLIQRALGLGYEQDVIKYAKVVDETVGKIIKIREKKLKEMAEQGEDTKDGKFHDLLSQFILMTHNKGEEMDANRARDVVMNFLIAGRDTTACLLTWTYYELSKHPEIEKRVVDEMNEVLANEPLSHETVKKLPYLTQVLSEVLRLHPPVPFDTKRSIDEDVLPDGTVVPAGSIIQYSPYIFGRMPWHWEDPLEFKPERWEADPNPSEYKFITFNAGPRICLGKRMAYMEATMVLCMVLPEFHIEVEQESFAPAKSIILWMKDGLNCRPVPRK